MLKLNYIIEEDKNGFYGYCPELKGCQTQGDSYEETKVNLKEAIELYISTLSKEEINNLMEKKYFVEIQEFNYA